MSADELVYRGSKGDEVAFDLVRFMRLGEGDSLRSRAWSRTLGQRSLKDVFRPAREVTVEVAARLDAADAARRVFDYDMAVNSPGTITMGGWSQRALVPESSAGTWRPGIVSLNLTVCLLDGVWRKGSTTHFMPLDKPIDVGDGKGYPHGYPYAYGITDTPKSMHHKGYLPAPISIVVFGAVSSPVIDIGGNRYAYDGDVPSGCRLEIDGIAKTAVIVNADGGTVNAMPGIRLGAGEGSGEYAFQPLMPGTNALSWDGSFGFDVTMYEEEGEPPWL